MKVVEETGGWCFEVQVFLGEIPADFVQVQLYAELADAGEAVLQVMECQANIAAAVNGYLHHGRLATQQPATDFTPRVIAYHAEARIPTESKLIICWRDGH